VTGKSPYSDHDHLPKRRGERPLLDPRALPRHRRGTVPQGHSRFPGMDVLEEAGNWDEVTRKAVLARVDDVPEIRFFTEAEAETLGRFLDTFLAQDSEPRVPALELVDAKLHDGRLEGYQYTDLPDDGTLWRTLATALDQAAARAGADSFAAVPAPVARRIVEDLSEGRLEVPALEGLDQSLAWKVVTGHACEAFWSHPWAWNEMGFPGPAYPRGYMRLSPGQREPYETFEEGPDREAVELEDERA
jgi:hypothetical protein